MAPDIMRLRGAIAAAVAAAWIAACGGGSESPGTAASTFDSPPATQAQALAATPEASTAPNAAPRPDTGIYIVQLAELPASAYNGNIAGLAATKPASGRKIDAHSPAVAAYRSHLASRHDTMLRTVGHAKKVHSYAHAFNGFSAVLTAEQALRLSQVKGVLSVSKDEMRALDTSSTPAFLGLSGTSGLWNTKGATGENVIIGIIDSGIWPEHPSFSDRATPNGRFTYQPVQGWRGQCVSVDAFSGRECNRKLIGARYYNAGFGGDAGVAAKFPLEFISPRDYDGHGTHTASTAGGNAGVMPSGAAAAFGPVSGIAPRARIAAYKVCWGGLAGGCASSDIVAAIDQAVADGVDVINLSISGTRTNLGDPVEMAFLFAADAGVFVAASAGNNGPAESTVAHPSPWLTTVAAGTHNRGATASVTLGNGSTYSGASLATPVKTSPFIDSTAAGLEGASPTKVALCYGADDNAGAAVLDPAKVAGKIVLCDRGTTPRVNKSKAVQQAGGVGMVLVNVSVNSLNADFHHVPTVHLKVADREAVKAHAAMEGAVASIGAASIAYTTPAPATVAFSSRGPLLAAAGDLLKPDLMAPGQDILAGVAPGGNGGRLFDLRSGTSMSSPHVAGLGALLRQLHPAWSPMAIKSALMTSAGDVIDGPNTDPLVIFSQGAGHVRPMLAANPGLVFDSGIKDWLGFLCGTRLPPSVCTMGGIAVLEPSNLNVASIAVGGMAGVRTVTRRVTNVGGNPATYKASYTGMAGVDVAVSPASLTLAAGETKSFSVTFTRSAAELASYVGGQLTWSDGIHKVRVPMVVQPVAMAAPAQVGGSYQVAFGYTGPFTAMPRGLVPAMVGTGAVATGESVDFFVYVPAGATYARFSLFDADVSQAADLDIEVHAGGLRLASSSGATSTEEVNVIDPLEGLYTIRVIGYNVPVGAATFKGFGWVLGTADAANMSGTAPIAAVTGTTGTISFATSGLAPGTKYLGSIAYSGTDGMPAPTIVRIDN